MKILISNLSSNKIYRDDSSICRAAVHSGAIKNKEGGIIDVIIKPGI